MPLEPSAGLIKKFKTTKAPSTSEAPQKPMMLRDLFEGIVDTGLGAIGVGPDSKANRVGSLLSASIPLVKLGKGLKAGIGGDLTPETNIDHASYLDSLNWKRESNSPFGISPSKVNEIVERVKNSKSLPSVNKGRYDKFNLKASDFPPQNSIAMGMTPGKDALYDQSGRYLGPATKTDEVFSQHVASSVGKENRVKKPVRIASDRLTASEEVINDMVKKYSRK